MQILFPKEKNMKPRWILVAYDSLNNPIKRIGGQDNVMVVDPGTLQKSVLEIYVFDGPLRAEGFATIQANIEGSKFIDEGYLFYPLRRHPQIEDIILAVFPDAKIVLREDADAESFAWQLMERVEGVTHSPLQKQNIKPVLYDLIQEAVPMIPNNNETLDYFKDAEKFNLWFESLDDNDKLLVSSSFMDVGTDSSHRSYAQVVNRVFNRIVSMTDVVAEQEEIDIRKVLVKVADGIVSVLGENISIGIDAFSEKISDSGDFLGLYVLRGNDQEEKKHMVNPFRATGTAGKILDIARAFPPSKRAWYIDNVHDWRKTWPPELPKLRFMEKNLDADVATIAYLPLIVGKKRVGMAVIQFSAPHKFTVLEKRELSLYAKVASGIIYTALLERGKTLQPISNHDRLMKFSNSLNLVTTKMSAQPRITSQDIIDAVYTELLNLYSPKELYIIQYNSETSILFFEKVVKRGVPALINPAKVQEGLILKLLEEGLPILIEKDASAFLESNGIVVPFDYSPPKSFIGVPIKNKGRVVGVIELYDFERENAFIQIDVAIIQTYANLIGTYIE